MYKIDNNLFDLTGRIALVTGGAGYLGIEMSRGLAGAGATVIIASRDEAKCRNVAMNLPIVGVGMNLDITDDNSVRQCMERIQSQYGKLDILVNNAAEVRGGQMLGMSSEDFNSTINGTLTNVFRMIQVAVPMMKNLEPGASIINIASMYGMVSPDERSYKVKPEAENPPDYGAAKAGVIQLTKYAACKLASLNIRVNAISPGPFPNPQKNSQEFIDVLSKKTPLKRVGEPQEIKGAVVFLASPSSSYITGHNLVIDGGWTIW